MSAVDAGISSRKRGPFHFNELSAHGPSPHVLARPSRVLLLMRTLQETLCASRPRRRGTFVASHVSR